MKIRRVCSAWAASAALLSVAQLCACSEPVDQKAELRRDVLRTNDLAAEQRKRFDEVRTSDDHGNLIPSDKTVAGVVLPRGYDPKFTFEYEWYFDGEKPYSKLAAYFTERLDFAGVERPNGSTLTFVQARTKGDSQMKPVSVTISPLPSRDDWSQIRIVAQRPMPSFFQTKEQIEAELALRKRNAH